jgi:hypothetical protein
VRVTATDKDRPSGVLMDTGTGKRIPFAFEFDTDTGEYQAFKPSPDGNDILIDDNRKPIIIKGKAVGEMKLVPLDGAAVVGRPARKVPDKVTGYETYKKLFFDVWADVRGEAKRSVSDRWDSFLQTNDFLDCFVLRRRVG